MKKTKKKKEQWFVWVSIGNDGNPIGVSWYKENLQDNVRRVRMKLVKP